MLEIEYKGANAVTITTKKTKVVVDPKLSLYGGSDVATKGAVQLLTEQRFGVTSSEQQLTIDGPGEYEVADLSIQGFPVQRHIDTETEPKASTMYRLEVGDIRLVLLGNIAGKLSDEQLEELGVVDMVVVPVGGGGYTLDSTAASSLVRAIDPKVVIPVHYADSKLKYEVPQDSVDTFIKELAAPTEEKMVKYKIKSASSLPAVLTVVELTHN